MEIVEILKIVSALVLGSIVQSSVGFGFSLVALPLLLFMGLPLPEAVMANIVASAFQKITAVSYLRKSVDWKGQAPFMLIGLISLPIGILCQRQVSFFSQSTIEQGLGLIILLLLLLQWCNVIKVHDALPPVWGYTAGFFSGFLNGLANIGGPPLALWILAQRWPTEKMRATPLAFSLVTMPLQFIVMAITFGSRMWSPMGKTVLLTPLVLLGTWIGLKIGEKIPKPHLEIYIRILLLTIVLSAILKPFL